MALPAVPNPGRFTPMVLTCCAMEGAFWGGPRPGVMYRLHRGHVRCLVDLWDFLGVEPSISRRGLERGDVWEFESEWRAGWWVEKKVGRRKRFGFIGYRSTQNSLIPSHTSRALTLPTHLRSVCPWQKATRQGPKNNVKAIMGRSFS
jgi:hypothetical protein